jgi:hypothetical protein
MADPVSAEGRGGDLPYEEVKMARIRLKEVDDIPLTFPLSRSPG